MFKPWTWLLILVCTATHATEREWTNEHAHGGWITAAAFSPRGDLLASCSDDQTIAVWESATGKLRWKLSSPLGCGASLAADGQFILLGEYGQLASLAIDPVEPRLKSITQEPVLPGRCFIAPALADGLLFLRSDDVLLCLNLRTEDRTKSATVVTRR